MTASIKRKSIDDFNPMAEAVADADQRYRDQFAAGQSARRSKQAPVNGIEVLADLYLEDPEEAEKQWDRHGARGNRR